MDLLITAPLVGVGLAMDCFAVSLAVGARERAHRLRTALVIAVFFGAFQAGMFLVGWGLGAGFSTLIAAYDHWAAFLLLIVGVRMVWEGVCEEETDSRIQVQSLALVTILAVATSIDALAVGFGLALLEIVPLAPAVIIGLVSACFSVTGVFLGGRLAVHLGRPVHFIGGTILILIGVRILLTHTGVL
ncbi:MAG: manganese efflux pump MntP family protein [Methanomicrobiales archaeon]